MAVPLLAVAAVSVFLQHRLQGFIDGFPRPENPGASGTPRPLHDGRHVLLTPPIDFTLS